MNLVLLLCVTIGLFSCECMSLNVRMTALRPRGFRACLVSEKGIESFSFYAYTSNRKNQRRIEGNATSPVEGLWCYTKKDITLKINDEIVFWYRVDQDGEQRQSDSEIKKFQASDFVDESSLYRPKLSTTSVPSPRRKSTTESSQALQSQDDVFVTPSDKVTQQEQTDYEDLKFVLVQPVTPKRGLEYPIVPQQPAATYELSASDLQAASEIFDNPPASDFVDESSLYRPKLSTTSVPSPRRKSTTESSQALQSQDDVFVTPSDKVTQQEQTDYEDLKFVLVQPVTPKRGLEYPIVPQQPAATYELSASDLQAASEIFDNPPAVPNYNNINNAGFPQTLHNVVSQEHSEAEGHHKIIEPHYTASIHIDEKEKNGEIDDRLIVSPLKIDIPLRQIDHKILAKGTDEYDYAAKGDPININIIINREATPCNTSALFGVPTIDAKSKVPAPEEDVKNKTKSCEIVLSRERRLGEAVRSSYQECVLKVNTVENDLIDSKKEAKVLSALLKETLEMINYLKVNSTNKLILKSSIVLTDYKQILRDVIHVLLDVKPGQYNIVKSELVGDTIVKFEVGGYNEKLLLFLNGRIKLSGSNFKLIDYDAHVQHQKQAENSKDDVREE